MSMKGKKNKNNNQQNNNNDSQNQNQKKKSSKTKKVRSSSNQSRAGRGTRGNRGSRGSRGNQSPFSRHHGSALPIPGSKTKRNRQRGHLTKEIKKAFEADSFPTKREKIRDLTNDAPFDEWNSFYSQASEYEIFNNLNMSLKSQKYIDVEIHETDYKIRGRKFINNIMCEFQIEMFSTTNNHPKYPNHILVEFQRRNGDGFVFQQFLSSVFTDLRQAKIIAFSKYPQSDKCWLSPKPIGIIYDNHTHLHHHNDEWDEKQNHDHGLNHSNNNNHNHNHWPRYSQNNNDAMDIAMDIDIDDKTLSMLVNALFNSNNREMCRTASSWLANNIQNNSNLVNKMYKLEPMILSKFSDLLLKCVDSQIVRSIGCVLYYMVEQSNNLKDMAIQLNLKTVCKKVYKRWTQPVESRFGSNNKFVIRVIPSLQVAQRMQSCIEVLE
eukprot:57287_1